MPRKVFLNISTTGDTFTVASGSLAFPHGNTVVFCISFTETIGSSELPLDLTGATALRCTVKDGNTNTALLLTFRDAYNQGDYEPYENLQNGKVTWAVDFGTPAIDTKFAEGAQQTPCFVEFTLITAGDYRQTLSPVGGLSSTIEEAIDDGASGTPPPSTPVYYTAAQVDALFLAKSTFNANSLMKADSDDIPVNLPSAVLTLAGRASGSIDFLDTSEVANLLLPADRNESGTVTLDAVLGCQYVFCDTTGGPFTVTLPTAAANVRSEFKIINVGPNLLTIAANGVIPDTINGSSAVVTATDMRSGYHFKGDGVSDWTAPDLLLP